MAIAKHESDEHNVKPRHREVVRVRTTPDYWFGIEQFDNDVTFFHCTVTHWCSRVCRELREAIDTLFALHGGPMLIITDQPHGGDFKKHRKACEMYGFRFVGMFTDAETGQTLPLYLREK